MSYARPAYCLTCPFMRTCDEEKMHGCILHKQAKERNTFWIKYEDGKSVDENKRKNRRRK